MNGNGIQLAPVKDSGGTYFDIDNDGKAESVGWVTGGDGLLCIDNNKNGIIDNQSELFGNSTGYANGFLQLASYDNNGDGKITAEDIVWNKLKVWIDGNNDGVSQAGELKTLDQLGITAINIAYSNVSQTISGNEVHQSGSFVMNGTTSTMVDAWFSTDQANSFDKVSDPYIAPWVAALPTMRAYGDLANLTVAMVADWNGATALLPLVQSLATKSLDDIFAGSSATRDLVKSIMYRWAGVDGVAASSRGGFVDGRSLGYLEKLLGQEYLQAGHESNPRANAAPDLNQAFTLAFDHAYAMLLGQTAAKAVFAGDVHYDLATDSLTGITGLNTSELTALQTEAKGLASTTLRDAFWGDAVRLIEYGFGTANLSSSDKTALNNAIYNSDHTLSLSKVLTDMDAVAQNPVIEGTDSANTMTGTTANETMNGHGGSDILTGGKGDDLLQGGSGSDTYKYNKGDGKDIIFDDGSSGDTDKILFGAGITASNITLSRTGDQDIRIAITTGTTTGEILVSGQFHTIYSRAIETLQFNDGSTINLLTKNWVLDGTSGDDLLNGVRAAGGANDTIFGHDGDDAISGYAGNDALYGDAGNDTIDGGDDNDILHGGAGTDTLLGGNGDDTLYGEAGDDTLNGGAGNDIYIYDGGRDTILDSSGTDKIILSSAYAATDAHYYKFTDDLQIFFDPNTSITIKNFYTSTNNMVETLQFSDGSTLNLTTVSVILQGTAGDNTLTGTANGDWFWGVDGNDTLNGQDGNDIMYGGAGNDILNGGNGDDTLDGGAGNDTVNGGAGNDTYAYVSGQDIFVESYSGTDVIQMGQGWTSSDITFSRYAAHPNDLILEMGAANTITLQNAFASTGNTFETLKFSDGTSIDLSQVKITTSGTAGDDTINGITFGASLNEDINGLDGNDYINGNNGNNVIHGNNGDDTLYGNNGDDTIYGDAGNDYIEGGIGNDILRGGAGNDTIKGNDGDDKLYADGGTDTLWGGNGNDTYYYSSGKQIFTEGYGGGTDTIQLNGAWTAATVHIDRYASSPDNMVIDMDATHSITLNGFFPYSNNGFEILKFSDGTSLDLTHAVVTTYGTAGDDTINGVPMNASLDDIIYGQDGNDTINGGNGNNILHGDAGNDTLNGAQNYTGNDYLDGAAGDDLLRGYAGNDTYYYTSGKDTFSEGYGAGIDTVLLSSNWHLSDVTITRYASHADDLMIEMGSANSINLLSTFPYSNNGFEFLKFADGTSIDLTTYKVTTLGTSGDDTVHGVQYNASPDDTIFGQDGNDTLYGDYGSDTLHGGNGNDVLHGGNDDDTLYGEAGQDTLYGDAGADTFVFQSTTAFANTDIIKDFHTYENDKIDIKDLFNGTHPTDATLDKYVSLTVSGNNTIMNVDTDGPGGLSVFKPVVTLENVTGLNVHDLLAHGQLIVA